MSKTPAIPKEFIELKDIEIKYKKNGVENTAYWRNAFSNELLGASPIRFYPTETLYGDWDGEVLFLAQDALPAPKLKDTIEDYKKKNIPISEAWVHADRKNPEHKGGFKTNETLKANKDKYIGSTEALYGSVSANMLFDMADGSKNYQRGLKGFNNKQLQTHMKKVLEWVIESMPNIKAIFCLGPRAWEVASSFSHLKTNKTIFKEYIQPHKTLRVEINKKDVCLIPSYHPVARTNKYLTDEELSLRIRQSWETLRNVLGK